MLWLAWYLSMACLSFVWLVGGAVGPRLHYVEAWAAAVALGAIVSTWAVFLASALCSSLSVGSVGVASALLAWAALRRWPDFAREHRLMRRARGSKDDVLALAVTLALALVLWPTYSARMIPLVDGRLMSGGSCYGDLPIHMTIANSFLVGCNTDISLGGMQSPIFAGRLMTYPFLPDFHAAVVVTLGGEMRDGFLLPGFSLACAMWVLVYFFAVRVTRSRLGAVLAVLMVVGAGGMGVWRWVASEWAARPAAGLYAAFLSVLRDKDVVQHDPTGEWKYLWFAFVPHIMLPQRGANFAYPAVVLCLTLVWMATDQSSLEQLRKPTTQSHRRAMLVYAGLLAALLPMFQAHSFIGLGLIIGIVALLDCHKWLADGHLLASWALAGGAAAAVGLPQILQFRQTVEQGFYGKFFTYGWLFNNYEFGEPHNSPLGLLRFWCYSLGPCLPLFLAAFALYGLEVAAARRLRLSLGGAAAGSAMLGGGGAGANVAHYLSVLAAQGGLSGDGLGLALGGAGGDAADGLGPPSPKSATIAPNVKALLLPPPGARLLGLDRLDALLAPLNALSPAGRSLDALKLMAGALLVFLVSNYINFQPWDRDNAKIYYVFIFVAAPINGALLAAPFEFFAAAAWDAAPGRERIAAWCGGACGWGAAAGGSAGGGAALAAVAKSAARDSGVSSGVSSPAAAAGSAVRQREVGGASAAAAAAAAASAAAAAAAASSSDTSSASFVARAGSARAGIAAHVVAHLGRLVAVPLFCLCVGSGLTMLMWEYNDAARGGGVLLDADALRMGAWVRAHVPQRAVVMHSNYHVQPTGALAGRPSLVAYYGWVSNHGYNANDRLGDRDYAMDNCLKDSDPQAHGLLLRWGVRYVLGEHLRHHVREGADPDLFLDGKLRRVHVEGRYELMQVLG